MNSVQSIVNVSHTPSSRSFVCSTLLYHFCSFQNYCCVKVAECDSKVMCWSLQFSPADLLFVKGLTCFSLL